MVAYPYFTSVNKNKIPIKGFDPDFPLLLNRIKNFVNLYNFYTGFDIFLGHGFVNKYFSMTIGTKPTKKVMEIMSKIK